MPPAPAPPPLRDQLARAIAVFRATGEGVSRPELLAQNWAFCVASLCDSGDLEADVATFLRERDPPELHKSDARLLRRLLRDHGASITAGQSA